MTESRAIELLEYIRETGNGEAPYVGCAQNIALNMAIQALEEVQQYRAIGTVEECKIAVEKMKPKEPIFYISGFRCPVCGEGRVQEWREDGVTDDYSHCPDCGQKLDWSE